MRDRQIARRRKERFETEDAIGIEAGRDRGEPREALEQQRAGNRERHRQRDLADDEEAAARQTRAARVTAESVLERARRRQPQRANRRRHGRYRARKHRHRERQPQHGQIDSGLVQARDVGGTVGGDETDGEIGERDAAGAAGDRQHHVLGQPLRDDPRAARAERQANRRLAAACRRAREEQVRHVGAGDEQHQRDRRDERDQRAARLADNRVLRRHEPHAPALVGFRIRGFELQAHRVELRLRGGACDRRLQPSDRHHEAAAARHAGHVVFDRCPHLGVVGGKAEARRHDADDEVRPSLGHDRSTDNRRIAAEQPLPDAIAEHQHFRRLRPVVVRLDGAAEERRRAEQRKERAADARAEDALGQLQPADVEGPAGEERDALERRQAPPVLVIGQRAARDRAGAIAIDLAVHEREHAGGIAVRRRPQDHGADDAEDGGVGADAERQRDDGGDGESRRAPQQADGVDDVARKMSEGRSGERRWWRRDVARPIGATELARHLGPSLERRERLTHGVAIVHAGRDELGVMIGGVLRELGDDVRGAGRLEVQRTERGADEGRPVALHVRPGAAAPRD